MLAGFTGWPALVTLPALEFAMRKDNRHTKPLGKWFKIKVSDDLAQEAIAVLAAIRKGSDLIDEPIEEAVGVGSADACHWGVGGVVWTPAFGIWNAPVPESMRCAADEPTTRLEPWFLSLVNLLTIVSPVRGFGSYILAVSPDLTFGSNGVVGREFRVLNRWEGADRRDHRGVCSRQPAVRPARRVFLNKYFWATDCS